MGADYRQQQECEEEQQWIEAGCPASEPQPFSDEWIARMKAGQDQLSEVLAWANGDKR